MIERSHAGKPALITFTADFHELVSGDLSPGSPVGLRYDPRRIIPAGEDSWFGDPKRPIIAHVRFGSDHPQESRVLVSHVGMVEHAVYDPTGQRSVLSAQFDIPADAEGLIVWFSYLAQSGEIHYDSDSDANYRFSFASRDLHLVEAGVVSDPQTPYSGFRVTVAAADAVAAVSVRYSVVGDPAFGKAEQPLHKSGERDSEGRTLWEIAGLTVPYHATVRFKLYYWIADQRYKDDNCGHYYLAPQPAPLVVAPPPPALAEAAQRWAMP